MSLLRRTTLILVTAGLIALAAPLTASAWTLQTATRSPEEIRSAWQMYQPTYTGSPHAVTPSWASPFSAGTLQPAFLNDGVRMVNFMRYLGGLPADIRLDSTLNSTNQHAAVLLAANNQLTHTPARPSGMSDSFYALGQKGAGSSNLAAGAYDLETAIKLYMADSDSSNIGRLGHRRWILNPTMTKTGMGQAGRYSAMWVFDMSRTEAGSYNAIAWPPAGPFPIEFFKSNTAWSATPNPAKYTVDPAGLTVTMRRVADGKTWTFNSADYLTAGRSFDGDVFAYNSSGYGVRGAIIFRPPLSMTYAAGDEFDVTISGSLYLKSTGARTTLRYRTSFMSLDGPLAPSAAVVGYTAPPSTTYSSVVPMSTQLADATGTPLAGRTMRFEYSLDNGATWRSAVTTTTDANGSASVRWTPTLTAPRTLVRARFAGDVEASASLRNWAMLVRPYLTITAPTSATAGRAFSVYGYLKPRHSLGAYTGTVRAYRYVDGAWRHKASFSTKVVYNGTTSSKIRGVVTLPRGTWRLKLYHPADSRHVARYSTVVSVNVR